MTEILHIATYNIHKGFSNFNRRMVVHELRERLRQLGADLVFLQEVQGDHSRHAARFEDWPQAPQYEFLADSVWQDFAYGRNAVYDSGHHGNAVLSRYPIIRWENKDISAHALEARGLLHCEIEVSGWRSPLHCVCVHLGLTQRARRLQLIALRRRIESMVPPDAPLIVAGDFNDWRMHARALLARPLNLSEVFEITHGGPARSFPSVLPLLHLDRIYVRGFRVRRASVHHGRPWSRMSDHAALSATVVRI